MDLDPGSDTDTTFVLIFVGVRMLLLQLGPATVCPDALPPDLVARPVADGLLALLVALGDFERAGAVTGDFDRVGAVTGDFERCGAVTGDLARVVDGGKLERVLEGRLRPGGDLMIGAGDLVSGSTGVDTVDPKLDRVLSGSRAGAVLRPL